MNNIQLLQKEEEVTTQYRAFLEQVQTAFNRHCDDIKTAAEQKLAQLPESDQGARQKVLDEQKNQLDQTLRELKQLLAKRELEVRKELEAIAALRDQQEFSLEKALSDY